MILEQWPSRERPREKLLEHGAKTLSDAELLAIFLRTGTKGINVVDLSRQLLQAHGGLSQLLALNAEQFCQHRGLGAAKYVQLQACIEMVKRILHNKLSSKTTTLNNPDDTKDYLATQLRHAKQEIFACLLLDSRCRVIKYLELFRGTLDKAAVYPREVVKTALDHNASALIVAHNHPSGNAEPSIADRELTQQLCNALDLVDIRLLDHIVIGEGPAYSFAEHGLMLTERAAC